MHRIALLDGDILTAVQEVEDLQDTIQALMLTEHDYVDISNMIIPEVKKGQGLRYDRIMRKFVVIALEQEEIEPSFEEMQAMQLLERQKIFTRLDVIEEAQALILLSIQKGE